MNKFALQGLQKICAQNDATYLIDEVQTGGGPTGKMWAHEHFDLPESPDIVTFRWSISPRFYEQLFLYKSVLRSFSLITVGFAIFCWKNISVNAAHKMWIWLLVSISATFHNQLYCMKMFCKAFLYLHFLLKEYGRKSCK